jgi:hypothetical protein
MKVILLSLFYFLKSNYNEGRTKKCFDLDAETMNEKTNTSFSNFILSLIESEPSFYYNLTFDVKVFI